MTRRERLRQKAERRREWAAQRESRAASRDKVGERYRHDWAFATQPGRIPERERMNRRDERSHEDRAAAKHHRSKAAGLEKQLKRTIFWDDDDAIEKLEARIAGLEKQRDAIKTANRIVRRKPKNESTPAKLAELRDVFGEKFDAAKLFEPDSCGRYGFPAYHCQNLGGNIRRCRDRLAAVKRQQERSDSAAEAGGVIVEGDEYVTITFAEKPGRDILSALKDAGFRWSGGSWRGERENIPACVEAA